MSEDKSRTFSIWFSKESLEGLSTTEEYYKYAEGLQNFMFSYEPYFQTRKICVFQQLTELTEYIVLIDLKNLRS